MKVLVTGHEGYVGSVLTPILLEAGHTVVGLDAGFYRGGDLTSTSTEVESLHMDVRDVETDHLRGFGGVIHLAALSNDPLGEIDTDLTEAINHDATVRLAQRAREAGVERFLFASSCSLYGAAPNAGLLSEEDEVRPLTAYARSKIGAERGIAELADDGFSPMSLRCATAYGVSPRLRMDLVVNQLVGFAVTRGEILLKSDGMAMRPFIHVEDIARAYVAMLHAPREVVHKQVFNVARPDENLRIRRVADVVSEVVPNSTVRIEDGASHDGRTYAVDSSKLAVRVPSFACVRRVREGAEELRDALVATQLDEGTLMGSRFARLARIRDLVGSGRLGADLRWTSRPAMRRRTPGDR